ncbi:hypothetical protein NXS19_011682 [Fusarium pseudograminearum]|nr:hypothetical protein NXS19_011682 [Fusarium pseudograminearum]
MTADQDVYRKTGRGGAGNYVVQNKADDADKDLEAQSLATDEVPPPDRATANVPARAGRGGSGNYVNPETVEKGLKMPEKVHHGPQHVKRNED